jgi:hypothetical protein
LESDLEALTHELRKGLLEVALPAFDRFRSYDSCLDALTTDSQFRELLEANPFSLLGLIYCARGLDAARVFVQERPSRFLVVGSETVLARLNEFHQRRG